MTQRRHKRGNVDIVFIDTNPYRDKTWEEVLPFLSPEQIEFIKSRQWTDAQKLRQAQDYAEENEEG